MKPPKIIISGEFSLKVFTEEGIDVIKEALKKAEDIGKEKISIKYLGGGTYGIEVTGKDYKEAEDNNKNCKQK